MSTQVQKKAGRLAKAKGMAVTTTAGREVKDAASATIVAGAAVGLPPAPAGTAGATGTGGSIQGPAVHGGIAAPTGDAVADAMYGAVTAVATCRTTLGPYLQVPVPGQVLHLGHPVGDIVQAVEAIAHLLRAQPSLRGGVDPVNLETIVLRVRAGKALEAALDLLLAAMMDTNTVALVAVWQEVRDVYHTANRMARTDRDIAAAIAPVQSLFQRTPRATSAPMSAADQTRRATVAANRAAKAAQKAATAHRRAAALAPPALPQPTPGPGVDQGPAHTTADPSATPVTPGSVPTR